MSASRALPEALAALDGLPDESMSLLVWQRNADGQLERPCTRDEIRAGLLDGSIEPGSVLTMARVATMTTDDLADMLARARRQKMRAI